VLERAAGRRSARTAAADLLPSTVAMPVASAAVPVPRPVLRPGPPSPRRAQDGPSTASVSWQLPSEAAAIPVLRRRLRGWLDSRGIDPDDAYDLLLAACEAATNAVEHAQDPAEPYVDVTVALVAGRVRISVRDYGQWRERVPSMDRGRGGTLMSAVGEITATPSPEGTTVVITGR